MECPHLGTTSLKGLSPLMASLGRLVGLLTRYEALISFTYIYQVCFVYLYNNLGQNLEGCNCSGLDGEIEGFEG
jgi:hypothetical protein